MTASELPAERNGEVVKPAPLVVEAEKLGKRYIIRHQQQGRYLTLREEATKAGLRLLNRALGRSHSNGASDSWEEFWAIRNLSFSVRQGEVVGIIGRNGAGKSTLLKLLSRITAPTEGRIRIRGRLASLLEVGTGFHPELTGRENIFLNGAVLGMTKKETLAKFDEIVEFAEASTFLDTAVKFYSSGMYMRLAFAVAAHLEPEILVVDEVLAVGDVGFQKKCLGKMQGVAASGRTVLFVSHNMHAVRSLCSRCILLDKGRIVMDSSPEACTLKYNELSQEARVDEGTAIWDHRFRRGNGAVRFSAIRVVDAAGADCFAFDLRSTIQFELECVVQTDVAECFISVALFCPKSGEVVTSAHHCVSDSPLRKGEQRKIRLEWPEVNLRPGEYPLYFWLGDRRFLPYDVVDRLTAPLTIHTDKDAEELGYDPSRSAGYFDVESRMLANCA